MLKNAAMPLVSVVMPVCNVEGYLRECLNSVCNQTLNDIEIICVDDKSDDGSLKILREFQSKDERFIVLTNDDRKGAAESRNRGISVARGKYLSILDADDVFEKDMLMSAYKALEETGADICAYDFLEFDDKTGEVVRRTDQPLSEVLKAKGKELREGEIIHIREINDCFRTFHLGGAWQKLYRRCFITENAIRFQTLPNANDTYFCSVTPALAKTLVYIHRPLAHYRINRDGQTIGKKDKYPLSLYRAFAHLYEMLVYYGRYKDVKREYNSIVVSILIGFLSETTEESRKILYDRMTKDKLKPFGMGRVEEEDFRYWREYWLAKKLIESSSAEEIISAAKDSQTYWKDRRGWCLTKIKESGLSVALWGYGKLGKMWMQEARESGLCIRAIIDEDPNKQGLKADGLKILSYANCPNDIEAVMVTNPKFVSEILEEVRRNGKKRLTIDLDSFIYSDSKLEDCIYKYF